jgi:hypothetical protein
MPCSRSTHYFAHLTLVRDLGHDEEQAQCQVMMNSPDLAYI